MRRGMIGSVLFGVWLGCFMVAVAQLPPEIMVDRHRLRAERLMADKDPKGAFDTMNKILALQKDYGVTLPKDFRIKYAQAALSAGQVQEAIGAINTYLLEAGREGKFYREALELLDDAEQIQAWVETRRTCAGRSKGPECWMEIIGQPGCFLWNPNLQPGATATWTGECFGGRAQGKGALKEVWKDGKQTSSTGELQAGKKHGPWKERLADGAVLEGPYIEGRKNGYWREELADRSSHSGSYVEGKKHGDWSEQQQSHGPHHPGYSYSGPYVEGKRHGIWVETLKDGTYQRGPYVKGKRSGQWIVRKRNEEVEVRSYDDGEMVEGVR